MLITSTLCMGCGQGISNKIDKYDFLRVVLDYTGTMMKYGHDHFGKLCLFIRSEINDNWKQGGFRYCPEFLFHPLSKPS